MLYTDAWAEADERNENEAIAYEELIKEKIKGLFHNFEKYARSDCRIVISITDAGENIFNRTFDSISKLNIKSYVSEILEEKEFYDFELVDVYEKFVGHKDFLFPKIEERAYLSTVVKEYGVRSYNDKVAVGSKISDIKVDTSKVYDESTKSFVVTSVNSVKPEYETIWEDRTEYECFLKEKHSISHSFSLSCFGIYKDNDYLTLVDEARKFNDMPARKALPRLREIDEIGEEQYIKNIRGNEKKDENSLAKAFIFTRILLIISFAIAALNCIEIFIYGPDYQFSNPFGILFYILNGLNFVLFIVACALSSKHDFNGLYYLSIWPIFCLLFHRLNQNFGGSGFFQFFLIALPFILTFILNVGAVLVSPIMFIYSFFDKKKKKGAMKDNLSQELDLVPKLVSAIQDGRYANLLNKISQIKKLNNQTNLIK